MKTLLHISAECYPIAKVGGLADVVGSLPKYQNKLGFLSKVVMPYYKNSYTEKNNFKEIYNSFIVLEQDKIEFKILSLLDEHLGFELYCVDIPELLYKTYVYSEDDTKRFLAFQIAVLNWILSFENKPNLIHVHDHHTGLIPFLMSHGNDYHVFKEIPSILTIHNAQYQGWFSHELINLIPSFDTSKIGLLDWNGTINPLATAIKCAWKVTTVSPSYMEELQENANGLEDLLKSEHQKCIGILNGIDWNVWNPATDPLIQKKYTKKTLISGKKGNKNFLCKQFNLDPKKPLFVFIGRLVGEKGAELLPEIFKKALKKSEISILLLGSGNPETASELTSFHKKGSYNTFIGYDEQLSHIMYAGADFILMPSRVEPCGLNQLYALRYGTIPIVNAIGGLKDTIIDVKSNGFGFQHHEVSINAVCDAIERAAQFYLHKKEFIKNAKSVMDIDHSWTHSASAYVKLYQTLIP